MTVSRVINGVTTVREDTRRLVRAAIAEIGYAPNEAARTLAGSSQLHIALIYERPSAYIAELLFGCLEQARTHKAQFIVEKCTERLELRAELERIASSGTDGLLIAPPLADSDEVLDLLETIDKPMVAVTSSHARSRIPSVRIDGYLAAKEMTNHIISLGHRRIGFIAGHPGHAASGIRLAGFRDAMADSRLECRDAWITQGYYSYRSGLDAAEELLGLDEVPTAIFACNDDMAAAACAVAHRKGLDVPGDISICGFDDTPIATAVWPELTTIHVPTDELSRAAIDFLVAIIQARRAGDARRFDDRILDYTLVRRHSDAAPRILNIGRNAQAQP
jgi:LacI family transcriptional regulator